jgi:type VI protein secretion system component VasF
MRVFDALFRWAVILILFSAGAVLPLQAQQGGNAQQNQPLPRIPGTGPPSLGAGDDPATRHMEAQLAKTRNNLRQQQLVADTAKLLELATQLKEEVDKSNKDTLSLNVVKKAEEIEKLAKAVKEKMRDAQ